MFEIACADWSVSRRKRAVATARPGDGWEISLAEQPEGGWCLAGLLGLAGALRSESGRRVLVGIDAALGLPAAFVRKLGCSRFLGALPRLAASGALEEEARTPGEWSPERPFFRVPAGKGGLTRFVDAAGGPEVLWRKVERGLGAKPVFALSGIPGTVGSGSRDLWRELVPLLDGPRSFRILPFEGRGDVSLAEIYPRFAASVAVEGPIGAKRRLAARREALRALASAAWVKQRAVRLHGVFSAAASEDAFDAYLSAAALARVASAGGRPCGDDVDPDAEGGILMSGLARAAHIGVSPHGSSLAAS